MDMKQAISEATTERLLGREGFLLKKELTSRLYTSESEELKLIKAELVKRGIHD